MEGNQIEKKPKPHMECINLLTALLVSYPQIGRILIEPEETILVEYTIDKILPEDEISKLNFLIDESLKTYYYLENISAKKVELKIEIKELATFVYITRDIASFSHGELKLINTLVNELFGDLLILDKDKIPVVDNTVLAQLDLIDSMIGSLKINPVNEKMIGVRESGRVIVFNK